MASARNAQRFPFPGSLENSRGIGVDRTRRCFHASCLHVSIRLGTGNDPGNTKWVKRIPRALRLSVSSNRFWIGAKVAFSEAKSHEWTERSSAYTLRVRATSRGGFNSCQFRVPGKKRKQTVEEYPPQGIETRSQGITCKTRFVDRTFPTRWEFTWNLFLSKKKKWAARSVWDALKMQHHNLGFNCFRFTSFADDNAFDALGRAFRFVLAYTDRLLRLLIARELWPFNCCVCISLDRFIRC